MANVERGSCRFNLRKTSEGKPVIEMELFHNTVPHLAAIALNFEVLSGITLFLCGAWKANRRCTAEHKSSH